MNSVQNYEVKGMRDPNQINGDNMNNARRETGRNFRSKKREYLKQKINELETNRTRKSETYIGA
jgi:uncharacterized UBP type Zn finger protein